jgi:hypothetical protein
VVDVSVAITLLAGLHPASILMAAACERMPLNYNECDAFLFLIDAGRITGILELSVEA